MARTLLLALTALLICATAAFGAAKRPDLGMVNLTVMADEVPAGGTLSVRDKVGNAGNATAKASQVGYYLSTDEWGSTDDIPMGSRKVSALKPGKARSGSVQLTVPNAIGLFRVIACADDKKRIKESQESNNCRAVARDIRITASAF
jgi:trimeric autotransporter adhesin